jgi:hypothetical protein
MKRSADRILGVVGAMLLLCAGEAQAAEGAASHYLPGVAGDVVIAQSPAPGWQVGYSAWVQSGDVGQAVLQGQVDLGLDNTTFLNLVFASYTIENGPLGASYTFGAVVPFGYADLDLTLTGPRGGRIGTKADSFDLSDVSLIPIQLNWSRGKYSFKLAHAIIAPTGGYDINELVNLGQTTGASTRSLLSLGSTPIPVWKSPSSRASC